MKFWKLYDLLETVIALMVLSATVIAVLVAGVGRTVGAPVTSAPQFAQLFLIWTCMLGADLAIRNADHIRVTALVDIMPLGVKKLLSAVSIILILPFLAFLVYHGWELAIGNWQRELGASGLSYGLVTLALPVGALLCAISFIRRLLGMGLAQLFEPIPENAGAEGSLANSTEDVL